MPYTEHIIASLFHKVNALIKPGHDPANGLAEVMGQPAFEELLGNINMGVALHAKAGRIFYVSNSFSRIIGHSLKDIYDQGTTILMNAIAENDKPLVELMMQKSEEALNKIEDSGHVRVSLEYHILAGNGKLKRIHQNMLPNIVVVENTLCTMCTIQDYTGIQKSPKLHYRVSQMGHNDQFQTVITGEAIHPCPYSFSKTEKSYWKNWLPAKA
jgi:hypothetical protein